MQDGQANQAQQAYMLSVRYRLVYDTLARYSCDVNKCDDLKQVIECLSTNIKYLFDSVAVKFYVADKQAANTVFVPRNTRISGWFTDTVKVTAQQYELHAAEKQVVHYSRDIAEITATYGDGLSPALYEELEAVWVFPFKLKGATLVATVFSRHNFTFRRNDIPVLKLVGESFLAKISSLKQIEETLEHAASLEQAYLDLEIRNMTIGNLINEQENIIRQRTEEIASKNKKLIELVKFNAHNVREPLSRILGLLELASLSTSDEIIEEILPALLVSGEDLDNSIRNVIRVIEKN